MFSSNQEKEEFEQLKFLQFQYLAAMSDSFTNDKLKNERKFDESKLTNKELMSDLPIFSAIDWNKIKIYKKQLPNNVIEFIYDFGEPKYENLCRFDIFYVDPINKNFEYFTL